MPNFIRIHNDQIDLVSLQLLIESTKKVLFRRTDTPVKILPKFGNQSNAKFGKISFKAYFCRRLFALCP